MDHTVNKIKKIFDTPSSEPAPEVKTEPETITAAPPAQEPTQPRADRREDCAGGQCDIKLEQQAELARLREETKNLIASNSAFLEREKPDEKFALTDLGNAERFVHNFSNAVCYVPEAKYFFTYDGKKWSQDIGTKHTNEHIDTTVRRIYHEAELENNESTRKAIAKWALKSEGRKQRDAILNDIKARLTKSINEFDAHPWLFNVNNGTVDLQTGQLKPHSPDDYLMKISPIIFEPTAKCPLWIETLDLFFEKNQAVIDYIQRLFGYSLAGIVKGHRVIPYLHGKKRNGKSTIFGTILKIFGDYGVAVDISTFIESKFGRQAGAATPDLSRLKGKRIAISTEIGEHDKLNEKFLNGISGGDTITARNLRADFFDFAATFTVWLFGNNKVRVSDNSKDTGVGDRLKYIHMTYQIPEDLADPSIPERLYHEEGSGILNWLIEGCLKFQSEGLHEPDVIRESTDDFFQEQDPVGMFIKDCCSLGETNSILYKTLYENFVLFSDTEMSKHRFSKILRGKGFEIEALGPNQKYVMGINLKTGIEAVKTAQKEMEY